VRGLAYGKILLHGTCLVWIGGIGYYISCISSPVCPSDLTNRVAFVEKSGEIKISILAHPTTGLFLTH
jgi:hypothetical protein